jgi:hypothetical protein
VARATVLIVDAGIALYCEDRADGMAAPQRAIIGQMACVVSFALAELISQPRSWRIAALVGAAQLLSPWIGLNAAALASASAVRRFQRLKALSAGDARIAQTACAAIATNSMAATAEVCASIATRLSNPTEVEGGSSSASDLADLQAGS